MKLGPGLFAAATAFTLTANAVSAADNKNAPAALIGYYGKSPAQCRSYHRKSDNLTSITSTTYTFCGGSGCDASIISHRKVNDGFILNLKSRGNPKGWSEHVRTNEQQNYIEILPQQPTDATETLVKCTEADSIAGIGLKPNTEYNLTKSLEGVFSAYYALAVPSKCPSIEADAKAVETIVAAGRLLWIEFLQKGPNARSLTIETINSDILDEQRDAELAVGSDANEIKSFCTEVLNVFGEHGRVYQNLLKDTRRKA